MRSSSRLFNLKGPPNAGGPRPYYPRFRPRRLVMPVDTNDVHSPKRFGNPLYQRHIEQVRLRRSTERRGAIKLSSVPPEKTVGDAFRIMLEALHAQKIFDTRHSHTPALLKPLEGYLEEWDALRGAEERGRWCSQVEKEGRSGNGAEETIGLDAAKLDPYDALAGSFTVFSTTSSLTVRDIDTMWGILDHTPLNAPVHGLLALRGKALVEGIIANVAYEFFPRLRSKHLQQLLHETAGLLPCSRVALRLGFAELANVEGEIGMWRELNTLQQRLDTARVKAAAHMQRVERGVGPQRRWYWRAVLRSAALRLKMFPVFPEDLFPRLEWIRSSIFAFIAFLELAEASGEANVKVKSAVLKLFCGQLSEFAHIKHLLNRADACAAAMGASYDQEGDPKVPGATNRWRDLAETIQREARAYRARTPDELEVLGGKYHPLNDRADRRRDQFESSGGAVATQNLRDDIFDVYEVQRHYREAPPILLHALQTRNALKEAQIILKYAPNVAPSLRHAPIDVDQVIRRTVEVHETNNYTSLHQAQQFRQVEYTVCRLFAGTFCIGEGKGETLMEAIQEAAQHMVFNYYVHGMACASTETMADGHIVTAEAPSGGGGDGSIRLRRVQTEEEVVF